MSMIRSPKTGRQIKVGGKTFNDLLRDPEYRESLLKKTQKSSQLTSPKSPKSPRSPKMTGKLQPVIPLSPRVARSPRVVRSPKPRQLSQSPTVLSRDKYQPESPNNSLTDYPTPLNPKYQDVRFNYRLDVNSVPEEHLSEVLAMPIFDIPTLEKTLEITQQPARRAAIERMIQKRSRYPLSATRGWSVRSPKPGAERSQLRQECGDRCFLLPGEEKFPICPSPRVTGGKSTCEIDCGGAQAAYNRARQWDYPEVALKAEKVLERCKDNPKEDVPIMRQLPKPALKMAGSNYSNKSSLHKKKLTWKEPIKEESPMEKQTPSCGCGQ